jgi:toxin-antitoxin system PIN domain toxin
VIAVDTNVLIYAHRAEAPRHAPALAALKQIAESGLPWAMPVFCISEFVRVVTHPRVFSPATSLEMALDYLERLLASPGARLLVPSPSFPAVFSETCRLAGARGNLVFDAQIVAVCREHGVDRILTDDRDFARFPQIEAQRLTP